MLTGTARRADVRGLDQPTPAGGYRVLSENRADHCWGWGLSRESATQRRGDRSEVDCGSAPAGVDGSKTKDFWPLSTATRLRSRNWQRLDVSSSLLSLALGTYGEQRRPSSATLPRIRFGRVSGYYGVLLDRPAQRRVRAGNLRSEFRAGRSATAERVPLGSSALIIGAMKTAGRGRRAGKRDKPCFAKIAG